MSPWGTPVVHESRMRPNEHIFSPPLCWNCRGAVLLNMPPDDQFLLPNSGPLRNMGIRVNGAPSAGAIPILRVLHNCEG